MDAPGIRVGGRWKEAVAMMAFSEAGDRPGVESAMGGFQAGESGAGRTQAARPALNSVETAKISPGVHSLRRYMAGF